MFRIFKNLFAGTHNGSLKEALSNGAYLVDVRTAAEFADGSIQNVTHDSIIVSATDSSDRIINFIKVMEKFNPLEVVRSGIVAMER